MESAIRPIVTVALTATQIALAGFWTWGYTYAEPAFAALSPFTSMVLVFWFKDRTDEKAREATVAAVAAATTGTGNGAAPLLARVNETTEDTNRIVNEELK